MLIPLSEATELFPKNKGKKVHVRTLKRRILHGCRGLKLHAVKDGGRWFTTLEYSLAREILRRKFGYGKADKEELPHMQQATKSPGAV